jgi:hypothetical protein
MGPLDAPAAIEQAKPAFAPLQRHGDILSSWSDPSISAEDVSGKRYLASVCLCLADVSDAELLQFQDTVKGAQCSGCMSCHWMPVLSAALALFCGFTFLWRAVFVYDAALECGDYSGFAGVIVGYLFSARA